MERKQRMGVGEGGGRGKFVENEGQMGMGERLGSRAENREAGK